jgi:polar amino acid transport system substrate-binding protein
VAGGWDATDERGKQVGQTDGTYADVPAIDSLEGMSTMAELKGKKVGTITGYYWVPDMQHYLGKDGVKLYPNSTNVLKDLVAGRIDAAVLSTVEAGYVIAQNAEFGKVMNKIIKPDANVPFTGAGYYSNFPHIKGNGALTDALNAEIAAWKKSGDFDNLMKKYGLPVELGKVG